MTFPLTGLRRRLAEVKKPRPAVAVRWLLAGTLWGYGIWLTARTATGGSDEMPGIGRLMLVLIALFSGGFLVSPDLVGWIVLPIHRVLDGIFLPSEPAGKPPADYHLARYYVSHLRYEEACQEYEKIVYYHAREVTAYLEGIQAAILAGDEKGARKFYQAARRVFRSPEKRRLVESVYAARHTLPEPEPAIDAVTDEPSA